MASKAKKQSLGPPPQDAAGIHRWLLRMQELVETATGQRGDGKAAMVERQDLVDLGLAGWMRNSLVPGTASTAGPVRLVKAVVGGGSDGQAGSVGGSDAVPGSVVDLQAVGNTAALSDVVLTWNPDVITFYGGANIYRANTDNYAVAERVGGISDGQRMFVDRNVDSSSPQFYWVRALSAANAKEGPLNQTAGTAAVFNTAARNALLAAEALADLRRVFGWDADDDSMDALLITAFGDIGFRDGLDGADGRDIELQNSGTHIQWRYVGDVAWNNLVALTAITGQAGTNGSNGSNGTNGSRWYSGTGAPSSGLGAVNDWYVDTSTEEAYEKTGVATWTLQMTLTGAGITVGETAPLSPFNGQKWVKPSEMIEYTWVDDGVSPAWVEL